MGNFFEGNPIFFGGSRNNSGARESSRQPVIPPAPLTGYRGRDRGDAGRALLFTLGRRCSASKQTPVQDISQERCL